VQQLAMVCNQNISVWIAKSPDFARKSGDFRFHARA